MSDYNAAAAERPDSRIFASYPMPAKIDLLNERPRRESQVERQLADRIGQQISPVPKITITEQQNFVSNSSRGGPSPAWDQQVQQQQQQATYGWSNDGSRNTHDELDNYTSLDRGSRSPMSRTEIKETRIIVNQNSIPSIMSNTNYYEQQQQQQQQQRQPSPNMALNKTISDNATILALELAEKEAKLMKEITALHERPYSPYQTPAKIDLTNESRAAQQHAPQTSIHSSLGSRPNSRASNRSQASQLDLMEKEAKLLREIEEIESKPYNPQTMLVEREQWFEYPENRPNERQLTESRRRVRDFCSLPSGMSQDRHIHEENLIAPSQRNATLTATPGSIHTTIIRSPKREIDNKSPLPFAFDNFTTKGVCGNIASANAVEPDRPRAPIFPIVKRSPSPNVAYG